MSDRRDRLVAEMQAHMDEPFPESVSVTNCDDYGEVCAVMIGADIYGWASQVSSGARLGALDMKRFEQAADELERSIAAFPTDARPYYGRVLRIAQLALDRV